MKNKKIAEIINEGLNEANVSESELNIKKDKSMQEAKSKTNNKHDTTDNKIKIDSTKVAICALCAIMGSTAVIGLGNIAYEMAVDVKTDFNYYLQLQQISKYTKKAFNLSNCYVQSVGASQNGATHMLDICTIDTKNNKSEVVLRSYQISESLYNQIAKDFSAVYYYNEDGKVASSVQIESGVLPERALEFMEIWLTNENLNEEATF